MVSTHKDKKIYIFLLEETGGELNVTLGDKIKVKKAYFLADKSKVKFKQDMENFKLSLPFTLPDEHVNVLVLELNREASEIEPREF